MDSDFESGSDCDTESYCDSLSTDSYDGTDRLDEDDLDAAASWLISPRRLTSQCAVQVVLHGTSAQLTRQEIPTNLYPTLLCEACRLRNADMVCHIVSHWPYPLLNLNTLEIQGCHFTKAWGKETLSLADMIVKGLLELNPGSKLKRVVLPDSECEGSEILRVFSRLPLLFLRHLPRKHVVKMINKQLTKLDIDVADYLQSVPMQPFTACKTKEKRAEPLIITLPGVVQWLGKHCNYRDVLVGLALQAYVPIQFCFEKLLIYNALDLAVVHRILELYTLPERTKKFIINNKKRTEGVHILLSVGALHHVLQRFSKLEAFLCKFDGMYFAPGMADVQLLFDRCAACFSSWKFLRELNLSGNFLFTKLNILSGLETPLVKLNLCGTGLSGQDFKFLAESKHVETLQYLNLDYIDLSTTFNLQRVKQLFANLKSLVYLRTCSARLSYAMAVSFAENLQHLDTLTHWNLLLNQFGQLDELVRFIRVAANIKNLKELGCKPFELSLLFQGLYTQSTGPTALSDTERLELNAVAEKHGITVY